MENVFRLLIEVYSGDVLVYNEVVNPYNVQELLQYLNTECAIAHKIFTELNKTDSYKDSPYNLTVYLYKRPTRRCDDGKIKRPLRFYVAKAYPCRGEEFNFYNELNFL